MHTTCPAGLFLFHLNTLLYYVKAQTINLNFGLYPSSPCFKTTTFRGMALPSSSGAPTLVGPVDGAGLYRWTDTNVVVLKQGDDGQSPKFKK
jgi:hypothetical protein